MTEHPLHSSDPDARRPFPDLGIAPYHLAVVADGLSRLLADSYLLYVKTHNYHWNVGGPHFVSLHTLFQQHYEELALAVDLIAERIRALGYPAPGSYRRFVELASVTEDVDPIEDEVPSQVMLARLLDAHETVARTARTCLKAAEEAGDEPSAELLTGRLQTHEKTAWMLRSMLQGS
jgi:starvation-inducible DNA-binding protein